jgi:hypothetical protein
MENTTELTIDEMDAIIETQCNVDENQLDEAIDKLNEDQLVVLREMCQESVERQQGIIVRVNRRLGGN